MTIDDKIKDRIKQNIDAIDPNAEAYLFGSRARGNEDADSDWDVLILINENEVTDEIEDKFRDGLYDLELETGQIISIFIYPKKYWNDRMVFSPLYNNVKKEGILL